MLTKLNAMHISHNGTGVLQETPCYVVDIDLRTHSVAYTKEDGSLGEDTLNNFKIMKKEVK